MNLHHDPEVKAIFDEIVAHTPELGPLPCGDVTPLVGTSESRRPWLAVAAATIALAGVGGVALLADRPANPATSATPPAATASPLLNTIPPIEPVVREVAGEPALYPVLDDVPTGLVVTAHESRLPAGTPSTEAAVGRVTDGVLTDAVTIAVQAYPYDINPMGDHPPTDAEALGMPATVYDYGDLVLVTWGTGPYYLATGRDPLVFLAAATPDSFHAAPPAAGEAPQLEFGALPAGYEVVGGPETMGAEYSGVTLAIGSDNYDVSAGPRDFMVSMSTAGPLRRIDVGGIPGWMLDSPQAATMIAWQVDATTFAVLKVNDGSSADTALAIAEALTWVDRDTWTSRYTASVDTPAIGTTPPTTADPITTVALGTVDVDGTPVNLAIDDGQLCRLDPDGVRQACYPIALPNPTTPVVRLTDGTLIFGYTLDTVGNLQVTVDGTALDVVRTSEQVVVGDVVVRAWAARLPEPNLAADRIRIEVGDAAP